MITSAGYQATFIRWGIVQGAVVIIAALFLKSPPAGWLPKTWRSKGSEEVRTRQGTVSFTSSEMASTPHFWLMYVMMTMVAAGGLMATAQLAPMAKAVVPTVWTPFAAKFNVPMVGWSGVFKVAIAFDVMAAVLAFFVLRKMQAPVLKTAAIATAVAAA